MRKILFVCFVFCNFYSSVTSPDHQSENNINAEKIKKAKNKKNIPFAGFSIHLPEQSFAADFCKWLTSDYAIQFNATSTMTEESIAPVLPAIANRMSSQKKPYMYMWFVKNNDKLVGEFAVDEIDYYFKKAILRYVVNDDMYGKKIGTKIMYLMLIQAFDVLHLHKVYATVVIGNEASMKIFKKFGFREVGLLKEEYIINNGQRVDMIYFEILRSDFEKLREKYNDFLGKNEIQANNRV